jgi:lipopolysaccharide transport system ATP-binding protein
VDLNGAIPGMQRAEAARKFDEIVAFAEMEKFIDTSEKGDHQCLFFKINVFW